MSLFEQKSTLAKLMATENMIVQQNHVRTASFDVLNRVLTIPIFDKNISRELYDLFIGHEVGHALWTEVEGIKKAKSDKVNMSVLNVVEDSRIERKIKTKYPGIRPSFVKGYRDLFDRNFFETEGKDVTEYNFIDRVNLHCKIGATLALPFTEDEKIILNEIESTETFEDAVEITKKISKFMQEQEQQKKKKVKMKKTEGSDESDYEEIEIEDGNSEENEGIEVQLDSDDDYTCIEEDSKSKEIEIRSSTDDAFRRNEKNLYSKDSKLNYVYANIPVYDTKYIMDYKDTISNIKNEMYVVNPAIFNAYRREASKVVSYLVKEFELRKNAEQLKRATTAKTGDLNMNRLYSFEFTDDIFKKISVVPQGKSHGLVMFLDWSGSMAKHFSNTVKQVLNLAMFCRKVNIPFDVYCFIDGTHPENEYIDTPKIGNLKIDRFALLNILSNRMNASDFTYMASALMKMSGCIPDEYGHSRCVMPKFMSMGGTPLNEAIIAAFEIVPKFQKQNRLQVVNTVFLTDGEGNHLHNIYKDCGDGKIWGLVENFSHMIIRDPKTRHEEVYERYFTYGCSSSMLQTDCLIRLLKARTNSHVIGFFVGDLKDVVNRVDYFWPKIRESGDRWEQVGKIKTNFRKENSLIVTSTGYDDYYILRSNGLDTDDDDELTFRENSTTRGMATAFSKYASNKLTSRVILNRFIGLIS